MAAELGNRYAAKARHFERALESVIREDNGAKLVQAARQLMRKAASGDLVAIGMLADRTDGKAVARSESSNDDVRGLSLQDVARLVMQARALDAEDAVIVSPNTLAAPSQAPTPVGDTPMEGVGGEGVVRVGPTPTRPPESDPPGAA